MDIPFNHFKRGMPEDLLQGVNIPAVLKIPGREGMPQQMRPNPGNAHPLFQLAEHLLNSAVRNRLQIAGQKHPACRSATGPAIHIPQQCLSGVQAQRNDALLIPLPINNGVPFCQMEKSKVERRGFIHAKAAVEHQRTDAVIPKLQQIPKIKGRHEPPRFFIGQNVYHLPLGFGQPEFLRKIHRKHVLRIAPCQKGPKRPNIALPGHCAQILGLKVQGIFPQQG